MKKTLSINFQTDKLGKNIVAAGSVMLGQGVVNAHRVHSILCQMTIIQT